MPPVLPPVVFVGAATLDAIALVSRAPGPDERQVAEQLVSAGGGPAATAAVAAARLGISAAFVGSVGDDEAGERIVTGLRAEGVDTSGVTFAASGTSGASVIVVDRTHGTRAICTRPAPPPDTSAARELLKIARWVHVDHIGWIAVQPYLQSLPAASRPLLSVDAGYPIDGFTAHGVDLFAPAETALRVMYGDLGIDALLDAALADGAGTVVATQGSRGSVAATVEGERCHVARHQVEVVSTLGAGDVFHGALLAGMVRDLPLRDCLTYANAVAALSCRGLDGRSAIPSHPEAMNSVGSFDRFATSTREIS